MPRQNQIQRFLLSLLASTAMTAPISAAEPSGATLKVFPSVTAAGAEGARVLTAPGDVFQGDVIKTNKGGEAQIEFRDDTRFVVGPNSKVTIDKFVFDPNRMTAAVAISAVVGTFRFIAGVSESRGYSIRTPTATIGIRGAALDFAVGGDGETTVLWQDGSGRLCVVPPDAPAGVSEATDCVDVRTRDLVVALSAGGFAALTPAERAARIRALLPFASSEAGLLTDFQIGSTRLQPPPPPRFSPLLGNSYQ